MLWSKGAQHCEPRRLRGAGLDGSRIQVLVDELLLVVEILVLSGAASRPSMLAPDMAALTSFLCTCEAPLLTLGMLRLLRRLVLHPSSARAAAFSVGFLSEGGAEALLLLLIKGPGTVADGTATEPGTTGSVSEDAGTELGSAGASGGDAPRMPERSAWGSPRLTEGRSRAGEAGDSGTPGGSSTKLSDFLRQACAGLERLKAAQAQAAQTSEEGQPHPREAGLLGHAEGGSAFVLDQQSPHLLALHPDVASALLQTDLKNAQGEHPQGSMCEPSSQDSNSPTLRGLLCAVLSLVSALAQTGYLRLTSPSSSLGASGPFGKVGPGERRTPISADWESRAAASANMARGRARNAAEDRSTVGAWIVYTVEKSLEAAPYQLMTPAVYRCILACATSAEVSLLKQPWHVLHLGTL